MSARILLVEDDPALAYVMKDNLTRNKFDVTLCTDGEQAQQQFENENFDLCILDVMLPKRDGFGLAQEFRKKNKEIPILFVTAKGMIEDKIKGFNSGGDDYIVKPFSLEELYCRIDVFLRRSNGQSSTTYSIGEYIFDCEQLILQHNKGESKALTQKEAEVLKLLCLNRDKILKREEILKTIWGDDDYFMGRSLDVFISRLRKYLKKDSSIQITNVHGVGFRLEIVN